ncbi:GNAT family N-acetyltransferase [Caenimonas koreensis DSM 17982]|uniref:GNAT family N-acetyltransferase n=1 Tax=Caenimonas koreensis DSM 17982 TaxID=1121255 RepID=A0A844B1S5_9BURK|nr:GNAT family N-acetyltransferase [Caenimonas koreensis]MRD47222.1 GNAT family N-acetyltransferase [Caenimonas koreensis DSM 17982]
MRSDPRETMTPNGTGDAALIEALAQRSLGVPAGERVDLDDLQARDRCGPALFASLARRFGWAHDDAGWLRERVPRWTPAWVQPHHEEAWMALFEKAFGYRMATSLWRWKYRNNPLPGMGAWRDGELVAFYGGMTREVIYNGKLERTLQIGDVMTLPDERAVMTRTGPFQIAGSTYIERTSGYGMPTLFGYGFPTDKALKMAERLGLYKQVDQMMELSWTPLDPPAVALESTYQATEQSAAAVDKLWRAMAAAMTGSVVGIRDYKYLADRYQSHPLNRYECLLVRHRITRQARGVVVMRDRGEEGGIELLDLIGPPAHWPRLILAVRRLLARNARKRAYLWTTRSHAAMLDATSPVVAEMELMVPANVWTPGPSAEELQGKWWLTGGDTDFR